MANRFITPAEMARDMVEQIHIQAKKLSERIPGMTEEKAADILFRGLCGNLAVSLGGFPVDQVEEAINKGSDVKLKAVAKRKEAP